MGTALDLYICDDRPRLAGSPKGAAREEARRAVLESHLELLRRLAEPLAAGGVADVRGDATLDTPLERAVARKAAEVGALLVVKDTGYHASSRRALFSNADWDLIRSCPAPLLLAKPHDVASAPVVLAAVDPTHEHDKPAELDQHILSFARRLTDAVRGELHVFHAFDPAPVIAGAAHGIAAPVAIPVTELTAGIERQHAEALEALLGSQGFERDAVHFHQGPPHELLIDLAERTGADFVVMGAVSRSGLKRVFVGSTAERVLDRLPCDLIIVKTP
jgi:universal stress protein E